MEMPRWSPSNFRTRRKTGTKRDLWKYLKYTKSEVAVITTNRTSRDKQPRINAQLKSQPPFHHKVGGHYPRWSWLWLSQWNPLEFIHSVIPAFLNSQIQTLNVLLGKYRRRFSVLFNRYEWPGSITVTFSLREIMPSRFWKSQKLKRNLEPWVALIQVAKKWTTPFM